MTWDDFFELGDKAKEKGIALFTYQGIYPGYLESMLWPALASATGIDNMKAIASYTPGSLSSDEALKDRHRWLPDGWHRCSEPYPEPD